MKKLMLATSAITILTIAPAMAEINVKTTNNVDKPYVETTTEAEVEAGWENTKETTSEVWESTKDTVTDAAETVSDGAKNAYVQTLEWLDTETDIDAYVDNELRFGASDLIGMNVYNSENEKFGDVSNLVVNDQGVIEQLIVTKGGLLGVGGQELAMPYGEFELRAQGDVGYVTNMTEADYSKYIEVKNADMADNKYLATNLESSSIVDINNTEIAEVEDMIIENGKISKLVVSYKGDAAIDKDGLIDFSDIKVNADENNKASLQLSTNNDVKINR